MEKQKKKIKSLESVMNGSSIDKSLTMVKVQLPLFFYRFYSVSLSVSVKDVDRDQNYKVTALLSIYTAYSFLRLENKKRDYL